MSVPNIFWQLQNIVDEDYFIPIILLEKTLEIEFSIQYLQVEKWSVTPKRNELKNDNKYFWLY